MNSESRQEIVHTVGIDLGKNWLHLVGLDEKSNPSLRENSIGVSSWNSPLPHRRASWP